jgi:hypothetical protein
MIESAGVAMREITDYSGQWHDRRPILHVYYRRNGRVRHIMFRMAPDCGWELGVPVRDLLLMGIMTRPAQ